MFRTITVFTEGDSKDASVWSNVPYYFTNTLEENNYQVHRVNVSGNTFLRFLYDKCICRFLRHTFMPRTTFSYQRSLCYNKTCANIIRKSVKNLCDTDCYISTSFSFAPVSYTDKPCALFCDWTYQYYFEHFLERKPDWLEVPEVKRQNSLLESVDYIFVLFPDVAKRMRETYHNKNIYYLGNVINSDPVSDIPKASYSEKLNAKSILFIGLPKYQEGLQSLIKAVTILHDSYHFHDLSLHAIGMTKDLLPDAPDYIHFHGYLTKSNPDEKSLYDSLIDHATMYVNTTPRWAGFSLHWRLYIIIFLSLRLLTKALSAPLVKLSILASIV